MPRLAASVALRIASGTSRALPWPKPTRPFWSPTTTSAANPKRRPPLTTLATRLMCTSLSTNSLSRSSRSRSRAMLGFHPGWGTSARNSLLEAQSAFAGGVGQRLDAAVKQVPAAVEHDLLDALGERALGQKLAYRLGGGDVGAGLQALAHRLFQRGSGGERLAFAVIDDLGIDVLRRAVNAKSRPRTRREFDGPAHAGFAPRDRLAILRHHQLPIISSCLPCGTRTRRR